MQTELSYLLSLGMEPNSLYLKARVRCVVQAEEMTKENIGFICSLKLQFIILDSFKIAPLGNLGYWSSTVFPITKIVHKLSFSLSLSDRKFISLDIMVFLLIKKQQLCTQLLLF